MIAKALPLWVYKSSLGDCTNNGISSRYDRVLILCDDGFINVDLDNPPENLCKVVTRILFGQEHKHIEPYASTRDGYVGWMSGGNFASSSDSRFYEISRYPLAIHDRQESAREYELYSR